MAGLVTTLTKNIRINLQDANFAAATHLKSVAIRSEFSPLSKPGHYAVIVPEASEDTETYASSVQWWQPVDIYVASRKLLSIDRERSVIGKSSTAGLDTVIDDIRNSLLRESPYNNRKPATPLSGDDYTTQTGVLRARYDGTEYMPAEEDEENAGTITEVAKIRISYLCVEVR